MRSTLVRPEGESDTRCVHPECPFQVQGAIEHFASRGAMDIEGLGERTIAQFLELGLLHDVASVYEMDLDRVLDLEGYGQTSVDNLRAAIEASKDRPLQNLLVGLNIRHVGPAASEALATTFGHLDAIERRRRPTAAARRWPPSTASVPPSPPPSAPGSPNPTTGRCSTACAPPA